MKFNNVQLDAISTFLFEADREQMFILLLPHIHCYSFTFYKKNVNILLQPRCIA